MNPVHLTLGRYRLALLATLAGPLIAGLLMAAPAVAQQGSVGGVVVAEGTGEPLAGVRVAVEDADRGTITGEDGRFLITGLSGDEVRLRVSLVGYGRTVRTVRVGNLSLRIVLEVSAVELDRIVVTGTAGAQEKRSLGNVVSTINAEEVVEVAPVASLQELINGRVAGAVVLQSTGMAGTGSRIRIRGASSFSLSNAPLIYVDGVRVNNEQATGPTNQGFGSNPISRFNDFDPGDIESIEIIKGPAAATLYGTEASNGVIQIITKKGRAGDPRFNLTVKQGANWFNDPEGRLWTNYGMVDGELQTINFAQLEENWGEDIFNTGRSQEYALNVRGGSDMVSYYASGGFASDQGVELENQDRKYNARANLTIRPTEALDATLSLGYVAGRTNLVWESGGGGVTWSTYFMTPSKLNTPRQGFWSGTPAAYHDLVDTWQDLNRFTGSLQVNHRPTDWFSQRLAVGADQTREENVELFNRIDRYTVFFSSADRGYKQVVDRNAEFSTLDYSGTFRFPLTESISSNTSVGAQFYRKYHEFTSAYGEDFPFEGLQTIAAAAVTTGSENFSENTTVGVFGQQQFEWNDRLFLTAGLRADDNSAFGRDFDLVYYPKVSGAWVVSEEPFWNLDFLNTLRLRAAYGESGQQPGAFDAIRTFLPVAGPGDVGVVTPGGIGNPALGPERGREVEVGFDAGLLGDRLGLEFTYYDKTTDDAILLREIAPSTGFSGVQFVNAGSIANTGLELLVRAQPYQSDRLSWDATFSIASNDSEVLSLGDVTDEPFISAGSLIQHRIGYPVGSWFEQEIVSAELDANGSPINIMCVAGPDDPSVVPCSDAEPVFQGRTSPDLEGAFTSALSWGSFRLNGLLDYKLGYSKLDGNERVRCFFFNLCRANHFPEEFDPALIASYETRTADAIIHESDFAKLRELSLTYRVPAAWAGRIGSDRAQVTVAGRNLATWTKYPGLEPEATFHSGSRGGEFAIWEQNVLPQLRQLVVTIDVGF